MRRQNCSLSEPRQRSGKGDDAEVQVVPSDLGETAFNALELRGLLGWFVSKCEFILWLAAALEDKATTLSMHPESFCRVKDSSVKKHRRYITSHHTSAIPDPVIA